MSLTSEQVHWIYGAILIAAAAPLILAALGKLEGRWLDFIPFAAMLAAGVEMALDPFVHARALPSAYGAEMAQHYVLSVLLLVAAGLEFVRARGRRAVWAWRLPVALALGAGAVLFAFHAQHGDPAAASLLTTQHRMFAATLAAGAFAFLVQDQIKRPLAFPLTVVVLGLQLLVYTEQAGAMMMHSMH